MERFKKLSVLIPVFNEEKTIREIIEVIRKVPSFGLEIEIVVVDDGSSDGTREILAAIPGIRIVFHEKNKGKGGAIKTAIHHATGDIMIIQDADLEYDPHDYAAMVKPILEGETELVMGSRFRHHKIRFFVRKGCPFFTHYVGNKAIIWATNLLYNQRHTDYEGCYKAFTARLVRSIPIETDSFDFDNELLCKALRKKHLLVEVPIRYMPRLYSEGKKITWKHGIKVLWAIVKWRFARF